jgi:hypothetical protein
MPVDLDLRKRQAYGLLIILVILVVAGIARASMHDLFPPGWWRFW